jgi:Uma2 family endonuclease
MVKTLRNEKTVHLRIKIWNMMTAGEVQTIYEIERNKPMPSKNHGKIQSRIVFGLMSRYQNVYSFISELSLELGDWLCTPDISLYPNEPLDVTDDEIRMTKAPLGVIEILSPTQTLNDLTDKALRYFENGVKSCWLVLPTLKTIYVFSGAQQYEAFVQDEVVLDKELNIELPLTEVFS